MGAELRYPLIERRKGATASARHLSLEHARMQLARNDYFGWVTLADVVTCGKGKI